MKAFLLAAGKGTRLQPLTFSTPKCLIPVGGRPLIEFWFDLFRIYGIDDVLINTSHLSDAVESYVDNKQHNFNVNLVYEETLLGSGGTIKNNWDFVKDEESFFIFYADNLTDINLRKMMDFHRGRGKEFTIAACEVANPAECGIIELDKDSTLMSFVEKPDNPVSNLAFAGIMISSPKLADFFLDSEFFDLGHDVLPQITGLASGFVIDDYLIDIGTPDKLRRAEEDLINGKIKVCDEFNDK